MAQGPEAVGPYSLLMPIASGGFGQVFLGRQAGMLGRLVALKGLSTEKQDELEAVAMLIDEARIASRVQHPNVVPILDVVEQGSRIWLVMEHVHGETLARLLARTGERELSVPPRIARAIACGVLRGLHAAHEAKGTMGEPLGIVHRDVSPHNVMVSAHGVARVLDFGIAKAAGRLSITRHGQLKGKLAYMAPEQLSVDPVDRRVDIYAAAVLISELFAGRRLSEPKDMGDALLRAARAESGSGLEGPIRDVLARGRSKSPNDRYPTAGDMADEIEATGELASEREVAEWLRSLVGAELDERRDRWEREGGVAVVGEQVAPVADATVSAVAIAPVAAERAEEGAATAFDPATPGGAKANANHRACAGGRPGRARSGHYSSSGGEPRRWQRVRACPDVASATVSLATASKPIAEPPRSVAVISAERADPSQAPVPSSPLKQAPRSAKPKKPNPDCDPPYKLDHRGVKVLKLECLR